MPKKSKQKQSQNAVSEPWSAAQPLLRDALTSTATLMGSNRLTPAPFGSRLADESQATLDARAGMSATAAANPVSGTTIDAYTDMVGGDPYARIDAVQENALREALPAAASYFENSGMLNSSVAQEHLAETAARAIAPIHYDAFNQDQNRRLQAMSMAPQMHDLAYADDERLARVGMSEDARSQQVLDDQAALHYETQDRGYQSALRAMQMGAMAGGLGGTQTGVSTNTQIPGFAGILGGGMQAASQFIPLLKG
jgi:ferric-dicitrate binding protein FerR (iron transport regulator)